MKLILAVLGLLALGAQGSGIDSQSVLPKYIPAELVIDPLLEKLHSSVDTLEQREISQLQKLDSLISITNDNSDFQNVFKQVLHPRFALHQKQQNQRLDNLEAQTYEIKALWERVREQRQAANDINDAINEQTYPCNVQARTDIEELQDENLEINSRIEETQQRADAVNNNIDSLFVKVWDNTRELVILKRVQAAYTTAVNDQRGFSLPCGVPRVLSPNNATDSSLELDIDPDYVGRPQFIANSIVGFRAVKDPYDPSYSHPSLYFGIASDVDNRRVLLNSVDMSTGQWSVDTIRATINEIYFGNNFLPNLKTISRN